MPQQETLQRFESLNILKMAAQSEWTVVAYRRCKGGKGRRPNSCKSNTNFLPDQNQFTEEDELKLERRIKICMETLKKSSFYNQFNDRLHSPEVCHNLSRISEKGKTNVQMVVYGIGSISNSETARQQLCLAMLMKQDLHELSGIEVFDPVISPLEQKVMESMGCVVLDIDEEAKRRVQKPTLFFMPHCEVSLYENLLQANWGSQMMKIMVVLGNSFKAYSDNMAASAKYTTKYIAAISDQLDEFNVDTVSDECFRAFHTMSWHFFPDNIIFPALDFAENSVCK